MNTDNSNVISLDKWKKERISVDAPSSSGGGGDDGYCQFRQSNLLSRSYMPVLMVTNELMGSWQFNQFAKKFNADVTKHNLECPKHQVKPLPFI